ncbi:MAG: hydrogenase 4 subunit F [Vicinamibacteria bacterium]|nr:hydrogenase 4 subunit F [Vicinamibacteria bacterium]
MHDSTLVFAALILPALGAAAVPLLRRARGVLAVTCLVTLVDVLLAAVVSVSVLRKGPVAAAAGWLRVDALSATHLLLLSLVGGLSSLFAFVYFDDELQQGRLTLRQSRLFGSLWCGAFFAITLLLASNNLGVMWVGMEATTLFTAFLISVHISRESLEAMWKYVLICSVAIAFAFMGTLITAAAAPRTGAPSALFWTSLLADAARLDPRLMRAAFVFLLVGYGTKAGLAPMHNWLPDAHSQAPAPVSALFSGFMLNSALYCILRYLPVVESATGGEGGERGLLLALGLVSLLIGAGFILFQHDAKRLLAYCSVEHIGLICVGVGLGGAGTVAALVHALNHSLAKSLAFFSAGRLGQAFGGHDIARMSGAFRASHAWGAGLLFSLIALSGAAPFAAFLSELMILKAAFDARRGVLFATLLFGLGLAFLGLLRHAIRIAWARSDATPRRLPDRAIERLIVGATLCLLLVLGLGWPENLARAAVSAARIIDGGSAAALAGILP